LFLLGKSASIVQKIGFSKYLNPPPRLSFVDIIIKDITINQAKKEIQKFLIFLYLYRVIGRRLSFHNKYLDNYQYSVQKLGLINQAPTDVSIPYN
jgi:hypothetical protein